MSDINFDFSSIVQHAKDVVIVTKIHPLDEPGPEIVYVNEAFTKVTGYEADEVIGKTPRILQKEGTNRDELTKIRVALEKKEINFSGQAILIIYPCFRAEFKRPAA